MSSSFNISTITSVVDDAINQAKIATTHTVMEKMFTLIKENLQTLNISDESMNSYRRTILSSLGCETSASINDVPSAKKFIQCLQRLSDVSHLTKTKVQKEVELICLQLQEDNTSGDVSDEKFVESLIESMEAENLLQDDIGKQFLQQFVDQFNV
jgi:hypothetical protein